MAKHNQATATLLATLEDRTEQIRRLEGLLQFKDAEIKRLSERCASQERAGDQVRQWLAAEQTKVTYLTAQIATLDPRQVENKIARDLATARSAIRGKNMEIKRLGEQLHRCLGWIDHVNSHHPTLNQPPKAEENRAMAGFSGAPDPMDEEIPF